MKFSLFTILAAISLTFAHAEIVKAGGSIRGSVVERSTGAKTTVSVVNNHKNDISYKLEATGIGGCGDKNQPLSPHDKDPDSCFCSWGTLNNRFIAYDPTHIDGLELCRSTAIGSCYHSAGYTCTVTYEGKTPPIVGVSEAACACVQN